MKKIIQLLYILFAVAAFSACSDDNQGEVVSQDLSYQLLSLIHISEPTRPY